eukprot:1861208-Rhodomonas_salina.6
MHESQPMLMKAASVWPVLSILHQQCRESQSGQLTRHTAWWNLALSSGLFSTKWPTFCRLICNTVADDHASATYCPDTVSFAKSSSLTIANPRSVPGFHTANARDNQPEAIANQQDAVYVEAAAQLDDA